MAVTTRVGFGGVFHFSFIDYLNHLPQFSKEDATDDRITPVLRIFFFILKENIIIIMITLFINFYFTILKKKKFYCNLFINLCLVF